MGSFSPLFSRKQPGGMYGIQDTAMTVGSIWYVNGAHSGKGTGTGNGYNPDSPFTSCATLNDSQTSLTAGDLVIVAPGHTESVIAAAGWDCDTAGVRFLGLGNSDIRPTITLSTANTADIDIDAANIMFENMVFVANFLDIAGAIDVNADGFSAHRCEFRDTSTILNSLIWILGATSTTSDRISITNCEFYQPGAANTHAISLPGTSDRCRINDNVMIGFYETAAIGAAGAVTQIQVLRNFIQNTDTDADACISLAASSTGIVAYNSVGAALAGDATTNINCSTGVVLIENYSVDTGDRQGVLDPAAT